MRVALAVLAALSVSAEAQTVQTVVTALPVLEIPGVPDLGGATVGRTTDDARALLQNPAALALAPAGQILIGTPSTTWFGESRFGTVAAAWTHESTRLRLGLGVAQGAVRTDARTLADGTRFAPTDRYQALSASVGTQGAVRIAVGATGRYITTTDAPVYDGTRFSVGRLRGATMDAGALVTVDVARLATRPRLGAVTPALDVSAGYAQTHVGGAVAYSGFARQALPRTGALGWSVRAGLDAPVWGHTLRLIQAEGAFQAERILARTSSEGVQYARLADGVAMSDAFAGTGTDRTTGRRGVRVTLAETLSLSAGRFEGGGYRLAETRGVEVRTGGLFRIAAQYMAPGPVARALTRADLRVGRTTVFAGSPDAAAQTTFSLVIRR